MAKECFCGCGRKVPFGRKRVTNLMGREVTDAIALFEGSIERTPDPEHDADLRRLIVTGGPLRDKLRLVLHGQLDRKGPRDEGQPWIKDAYAHKKRLAAEMVGAGYAGGDPYEQSDLVRTGVAAPAEIVNVADTGMTLNENPRVELTLRVTPADGTAPFDLQRKLVVPRVHLPRVGERLTVYYSRDDPEKFTFRHVDASARDPAGAAEPDPVEQIAKLADLHAKGALSDAEFAEAKQRLLDDL